MTDGEPVAAGQIAPGEAAPPPPPAAEPEADDGALDGMTSDAPLDEAVEAEESEKGHS